LTGRSERGDSKSNGNKNIGSFADKMTIAIFYHYFNILRLEAKAFG
jgi:hypothetical protein